MTKTGKTTGGKETEKTDVRRATSDPGSTHLEEEEEQQQPLSATFWTMPDLKN
jgi:hypothetical protein